MLTAVKVQQRSGRQVVLCASESRISALPTAFKLERADCQTASRSPIQANRRRSARAKELCGGVEVEQEKLQYPK